MKTKTKPSRLNARVPSELSELVKQRAREDRTTFSDIITKALESYLK